MTSIATRESEGRLDASAWTGRRARSLLICLACALAIVAVVALAWSFGGSGNLTNFAARSLPPSQEHPFGTDPLGRDLFVRTMQGLSLSLWVGLLAASASAAIALVLALLATTLGRTVDAIVALMTDMFLGIPHLVLLILIAFSLGGGRPAVVTAVAVTHWPRLARILRAEILEVLGSDYVRISRRFGRSWAFIARRHLLPHAVPQLVVGTLLLFPHAILHEAGLTFLGFGFEPNTPAIGVLLSEAMRHITAGYWWLGVFPGCALLLLVLCLDGVGSGLRTFLSPREAQD
jgi:peptide/nickel transport system permease protein